MFIVTAASFQEEAERNVSRFTYETESYEFFITQGVVWYVYVIIVILATYKQYLKVNITKKT